MTEYNTKVQEISKNVKMQFLMEEYFSGELKEYEKKIKWSYYLRVIILIVIVLV